MECHAARSRPARSISSPRSPTFPTSFSEQLHPAASGVVDATKSLKNPTSDEFSQIVALVRDKTSHDFSVYKKGTLERRLEHRMNAVRIEDRPLYLKLLREKPGEAELLRNDLLIGVTQFFRGEVGFRFPVQ